MRKDRLTRIKITFLIAAVLLLSLSIFSYVRINNLMKSSAWVNHTATVKLDLETYFSCIKDIESSMRGYLLSKDSLYISEFNAAVCRSNVKLLQIRNTTTDNYSQRENLKILEEIAGTRIANMKDLLQIGDFQKIPKQKRMKYRANRALLRHQIDKMIDGEDQLLRIRKKTLIEESAVTPFFAAFLMICSIIVLIVSYNIIYRELKISNVLRADLEDKNESLEKMNTELESFTYISSHDLQEPLRKIQTFLSRIRDQENDSLSDTGRNYMQRAQESANRMQNLIRDLLAYSRLSVEIFPVENANLSMLVDEIRNDFEEEIHRKNVIIEVVGDPNVKVIVSQFRQLAINLISNSIKFSAAEKTPHITITNESIKGSAVNVAEISPDQLYSKITFSDNGIGFEPQYSDRIFKVFQRLHIDQQFAGTGIGLAIVKKIIDNHNGFITGDGEVGNGAVFTIYIPA